ncbi:MAG: hypothetical protein CVV21_05890 [Candidatus Goldiibacteriota bacterium HGW-Goldbacteria-1]|jgi:para-aminobenzoate synthetase/4-amino-4-deoxychorismate lyase|nr:MAG: hypothetical protein CVV21_05890 [Candidatus Goldiibacteriota bacterium HGW-Goldbacteria-1]
MNNLDELKSFLTGNDNGIFLYSAPDTGGTSYLFTQPLREIKCDNADAVNDALKNIADFTQNGYYAAGLMAYEAGYGLEKKFHNVKNTLEIPFLEFGVYKTPYIFKKLDILPLLPFYKDRFCVSSFDFSENFKTYKKKFSRIMKLINNGDTYQVNHCFNVNFHFQGNSASLFAALCTTQPVSYAAFIRIKNRTIISLSPELFFSIKGRQITMRPMKGTLLKNKTIKDPVRRLKNEKGMAENIMIVDLLRNDLGRICETGSINAPKLFEVEEYRTLYQMTSTVRGRLKGNADFNNIITALFPSGSVTGAPKISAMNIIHKTEKSPRGVYTGAIGFTSKEHSVFSIPIRTIELADNTGKMGIGSGIVHDSNALPEYKECLGKASFLTELENKYRIIESLLLKNGRYFLPNLHLKRMKKSASFFKIKFSAGFFRKTLADIRRKKPRGEFKVRVMLSPGGKISAKAVRLSSMAGGKTAISNLKIDSSNIYLYHKTENRKFYDSDFNKYAKKGFADVIYLNENNEVTEAHSSNIFAEIKGIFYTPPVSCGLLPGTFREYLLKKNPSLYKERVLHAVDLVNADNLYLVNSVRGFRKVTLV